MAEEEKYTKAQLKRFYDPGLLASVNRYIHLFRESVELYCDSSKDFWTHRNTVLRAIDEIVDMTGVQYEDVCLFAHCLQENLDLMDGKMTPSMCGHLYFVESSNHIKIGRTKDIKTRFASLQTDNADILNLKHVQYNCGDYEFSIHRMFFYLKAKGEWFEKHDDIYSFIDKLKQFENKEINERFYSPFIETGTNELMKCHIRKIKK